VNPRKKAPASKQHGALLGAATAPRQAPFTK
jgi:hypothetical protein